MSKKLEGSSKVSASQQIPALLFAAIPPLLHDNRKSWLARVARTLSWGPRRTRALFYLEARIVTADEWRTINERLDAAKQRERAHNEHRLFARGVGAPLPVDARENPSLPMAVPAGAPIARPKRQA